MARPRAVQISFAGRLAQEQANGAGPLATKVTVIGLAVTRTLSVALTTPVESG